MNHHVQTLLAVILVCTLPVEEALPEEETRPKNTAGEVQAVLHPKAIRWSFLAPESGKPFNDPFSKLSQNQLADLSYLVRVRRLIAQEKIKADGGDAKEAAELARKLTNEGIDIDWLMVQRERVRKIRGLQVESLSKSIAKSLSGKQVTLTGYVIPIKTAAGRLTEFFLVPTSAVCSNEAAPSPLQVLFIAIESGIANPGTRTTVRVTGTIQAQTTKNLVRNGIAIKAIQSAYMMLNPQTEAFVQPNK